MRIAVVGDRNFKDSVFVESVLTQFCEDNKLDIFKDISLVSGGAKGVDSSAREIAKLLGVQFTEFLPKSHQKWSFLDRNRLIVDNSDHVLAFLTEGSRGTRYTVDYAKKVGKPVTVVGVTLNRVLDGFTLSEDMELDYVPDKYGKNKKQDLYIKNTIYGPMYSLFKVPKLEGLSSSAVKSAISGKSKSIVYNHDAYSVFINTAKGAISDVVEKYNIDTVLQISGSSPLMSALMDELSASLDAVVYPASLVKDLTNISLRDIDTLNPKQVFDLRKKIANPDFKMKSVPASLHSKIWNFMSLGEVPAEELHGKNVLIIEDIITEGSTLRDSMRAVKEVSESSNVVGLSIWK